MEEFMEEKIRIIPTLKSYLLELKDVWKCIVFQPLATR